MAKPGRKAKKANHGKRPANSQGAQIEAASRSHLTSAESRSSGKEQSVAKRQLILDFSEYDLNTVIADIEEIHRWNPQRYEMEQLTAICFEDSAAVHLRRLQGPWSGRVLGSGAHARHAADARGDHVRGGGAVVQLFRPSFQADERGGRLRRPGGGAVPRHGPPRRPLRHRQPPAEGSHLDHDLRIPVLRQPEPGLRRHHQGDRLAGRSTDRRRQHRRRRRNRARAAPACHARTSPAFQLCSMGRRSLRKIDPDIDLSRHLRTSRSCPGPGIGRPCSAARRRWRWRLARAKGFS